MKPIIEFRNTPSIDLTVRIRKVYGQVISVVKEEVGLYLPEKTKARFIVDTIPHIQAARAKFTEIQGGQRHKPYEDFEDGVRIWTFPLLHIEGYDILYIGDKVGCEHEAPGLNYICSSAGVLCWVLPHEFAETHVARSSPSVFADEVATRWFREGIGNYTAFIVSRRLQPTLHSFMVDYYLNVLKQRTEANLIKDWPEDPTQQDFYYGASMLFFLHAAALRGPNAIPCLVKAVISEEQSAKENLWAFTANTLQMSYTESAGEFRWNEEMVSQLLHAFSLER